MSDDAGDKNRISRIKGVMCDTKKIGLYLVRFGGNI